MYVLRIYGSSYCMYMASPTAIVARSISHTCKHIPQAKVPLGHQDKQTQTGIHFEQKVRDKMTYVESKQLAIIVFTEYQII